MKRQQNVLVRTAACAYRAAQRVMTLDITRLILLEADRVHVPAVDPRYRFVFLAANEVMRFVDVPENLISAELAARLSGGRDHCFAAFDGDRLASYVWIAEGSIEAQQNRGRHPATGVAASFDDDAGFAYHAFTLPEYRGRQLNSACLALALQRLAPRGVTRLWTTTDWTNAAFRAACRKIGGVEFGSIWCWGWGNAVFKIPPRRAATAGIRFGRQAEVESRSHRECELLEI